MLTFVVGVCWYRIIPDRSRYKGNHRLLKRAKKPAAELVARGNGQRGEAAAFAKSCPPVKSIEAPAPTDEDSNQVSAVLRPRRGFLLERQAVNDVRTPNPATFNLEGRLPCEQFWLVP